MGWVEDLAGKTVGIDTAPLIYFIEQRQPYVDVLRPFFQSYGSSNPDYGTDRR